jgi:ABA DEFICIENT 4-like
MTPELIFSICSMVAMAGWILLIVTPRRSWASTLVAGRVIPLLLAGVYLIVLVAHWGERTGGFSSLAAVAALFSNRWLLLAGWIHYLAFDLFVGSWEVRDAEERKLSPWLLIPCVALTSMLGPIGLLSYFAVRSAAGKLQAE